MFFSSDFMKHTQTLEPQRGLELWMLIKISNLESTSGRNSQTGEYGKHSSEHGAGGQRHLRRITANYVWLGAVSSLGHQGMTNSFFRLI